MTDIRATESSLQLRTAFSHVSVSCTIRHVLSVNHVNSDTAIILGLPGGYIEGVRKILRFTVCMRYFRCSESSFALKIPEGSFRCCTRKYARKVGHSELHKGRKSVNSQDIWSKMS